MGLRRWQSHRAEQRPQSSCSCQSSLLSPGMLHSNAQSSWGNPPFQGLGFFFLPEQATLVVAENHSCPKPDLPKTWFEVWFPLEGGVCCYSLEGGVGCAFCCDGWKPAPKVMAAGRGNHSCPNPKHQNGVRELMGAIWPDRGSGLQPLPYACPIAFGSQQSVPPKNQH